MLFPWGCERNVYIQSMSEYSLLRDDSRMGFELDHALPSIGHWQYYILEGGMVKSEAGSYPKLAIIKLWGIQFFKGYHYILRL